LIHLRIRAVLLWVIPPLYPQGSRFFSLHFFLSLFSHVSFPPKTFHVKCGQDLSIVLSQCSPSILETPPGVSLCSYQVFKLYDNSLFAFGIFSKTKNWIPPLPRREACCSSTLRPPFSTFFCSPFLCPDSRLHQVRAPILNNFSLSQPSPHRPRPFPQFFSCHLFGRISA